MLAADHVQRLKTTEHTAYYAVSYPVLKETVLEQYRYVQEALEAVEGQVMTDHAVLAPGVSRTVYSGGTKIYVNYNPGGLYGGRFDRSRRRLRRAALKGGSRLKAAPSAIRRPRDKRDNQLFGLLFTLPFILGFVFIFLYIFITAIRFSVSDMSLGQNGFELSFVWLENFRYALRGDPNYVRILLDALKIC